MKPNLKNIVIIPFLLLSFFVVSQAGNTDFSFNSNIVDRFGNSDGISENHSASMLLQSDGKIILAGSFSKYNGKNCSKIIRLNSDGSIDNSFNAGVTVSNSQSIQSLRLQSDGKILVGGNFTTYGGQSLSAIVRLHSDGSIDNSFQFSVPETNCHVKSIRLDASNNIYIGTFSGPLGFGTGKVYKLTSSGALDPNFEITYLPFTVSSSNWVNVIELQSDGKILVGGTYGLLKRLNTNGSLDLTFNTVSLSYDVLSIVPLPNGKVVVGGLTLLRRLNADGTFDNTYAQSGTQFYGGDVRNMTLLSNGQILASGTSSLGNGLWKINSDGTIDTSIQLEESGIAYTTILSQFIQPDGKILLSGGFSTNKFRVSFGIERFNSNGEIDSTFNINNGLNQSGVVNDLEIFQNGDILIAGDFSSYNQIPQKSVSKLKANGQLDNSFNISVAPDAEVFSCAIQKNGKFFLGGNLGVVNGYQYQKLSRFNSDGTFDPSFSFTNGINGEIVEIEIQNDDKIMIGGNFSLFENQTTNNIVRLNQNGSRDISFQASLNYTVNTIAIQPDGKYLVGGDFDQVNGSSTHRGGIVRLNADGSIDESFVAYGVPPNGGFVSEIALQMDGKIVVGGNFSNFNNLSYQNLVRLNADGSIDNSFNPNYEFGFIYDLLIEPDNKILVASYSTDGSNYSYLCRLLSNGSGDNSFSNFRNTYSKNTYCFEMQPDGKIVIGGEFYGFDFDFYHGVIRLLNDTNGPQPFNLSFTDVNNVNCNSDGYAVPVGNFGYPPYTYSWTSFPGYTDTAFFNEEGVYTCTVTDSYQNTATASLLISGPTSQSSSDISLAIAAEEFRPGFQVVVNPTLLNDGCLPVDGILKLEFDPLLSFISATSSPYSISGNSISWNVNQLTWDSSGFVPTVTFTCSSDAEIGDSIFFKTNFYPSISSFDSVFRINYFPVVNGFDPNDILVIPGKCEEGFVSKDQELTYTIRFQNTGNSHAVNISVHDILDENLDISSLRLIGSSDSYWVEIAEVTNQTQIIFHFDQIYLPAASMNESESHGYIQYSMKPKSDLLNGEKITGTASIFFDYNYPIQTNTSLNTIYDGEINQLSCYKGSDLTQDLFVCFPNPVKELLNIYSSKPFKSIQVFDVAGQLKYSFTETTSSAFIQTVNFSNGIYFVKVESVDGEKSTKKIIISN